MKFLIPTRRLFVVPGLHVCQWKSRVQMASDAKLSKPFSKGTGTRRGLRWIYITRAAADVEDKVGGFGISLCTDES